MNAMISGTGLDQENGQPVGAMLERCLRARMSLPEEQMNGVIRLFNGFYEGLPGLVVDLFGRTLVIGNHAREMESVGPLVPDVVNFYLQALPGIKTVLLKERHAAEVERRKGVLLRGETLDERVRENGVWYALDLRLNQDSSFYPDTRHLREWLKRESAGAKALNCFAYTGALGIAALAGGAEEVIQGDSNRAYLAMAGRSAGLNDFSGRMSLLAMDFFKMAGKLKAEGRLFDLVLLDPPLFSSSKGGRVDLLGDWLSLINKVRPLVAHEGRLVVVNNALYLPGEAMMGQLKRLEESGYARLEAVITVPEDITGYAETIRAEGPADPAPFNHATKISVVGISRKDKAGAR